MADTDILTVPEAYAAVNIPAASGHDDELGLWISAVSRRIDELCGPVVRRNITGETHDGGRPYVILDELYATEASSVSEYRHTTEVTLTAETNAAKPADAYLLDDVGSGITYLRRRTSGSDSRFPSGRRNIDITYTAGRYANTASVDGEFKTAVGAILRRLWQRDQASWATGGDPFDQGGGTVGFFKAIDPMVTEWLGDQLRPPTVL